MTAEITAGVRPGVRAVRALMMAASLLFLSSAFFSIAVNSLSLGAMGISWILLMAIERRWRVRPTPLDYAFLAFVLAELLAMLWSPNPWQALFFSRRVGRSPELGTTTPMLNLAGEVRLLAG